MSRPGAHGRHRKREEATVEQSDTNNLGGALNTVTARAGTRLGFRARAALWLLSWLALGASGLVVGVLLAAGGSTTGGYVMLGSLVVGLRGAWSAAGRLVRGTWPDGTVGVRGILHPRTAREQAPGRPEHTSNLDQWLDGGPPPDEPR